MKKRVFLSLTLPKDLKEKIAYFSKNIENFLLCGGVRMEKEENLHITLHFLGDQTLERIKKIEKATEIAVVNFKQFVLGVKEIGAFPNIQFPRVIFLEIFNSEYLKMLHKELIKQLKILDINDLNDKKLRGHITLARIKFGKIDFKKIEEEVQKYDFGNWQEKGVDMVESISTMHGHEYNILKTFKFN